MKAMLPLIPVVPFLLCFTGADPSAAGFRRY